jgi:hypothetical protein
VTSVRKRISYLTDRVLLEITTGLSLAYQLRPLPSLIQRWRDHLEIALVDAMLVGKAEAEVPLPLTAELADTQPVKGPPKS